MAVVDDADDARLLARLMLEDAFDVATYDGGAAGLAGIRAAPPDVVLLDLQMPEPDGWEVLRRLRADPRLAAIPVLAFSAGGPSRAALTAAGFAGLVEKPVVNHAALAGAVMRVATARRRPAP